MLDYEDIKNDYRLIELDADTKAVQQIEFIRQLKNDAGQNADGIQSMFVLTVLEKIKEARLKSSHGSVTVL